MLVTPTYRRLRQEDCKPKACLYFTESSKPASDNPEVGCCTPILQPLEKLRQEDHMSQSWTSTLGNTATMSGKESNL